MVRRKAMFYDVPSQRLKVVIDGQEYEAKPRKFSSGSVGWYLGGKVMIDGTRVQMSCSLVVVGSKPPQDLIDVDSTEQLSTSPAELQRRARRQRKAKAAHKPSENGKRP
jgi:hypothetical protein